MLETRQHHRQQGGPATQRVRTLAFLEMGDGHYLNFCIRQRWS